MRKLLTRPLIAGRHQVWLSLLVMAFAIPNTMHRPRDLMDDFVFAVCCLFAFVFAFNSFLDAKRMSFLPRMFIVFWFAALLLLTPLTVFGTFQGALYERSHPSPSSGAR